MDSFISILDSLIKENRYISKGVNYHLRPYALRATLKEKNLHSACVCGVGGRGWGGADSFFRSSPHLLPSNTREGRNFLAVRDDSLCTSVANYFRHIHSH